MDTQQKRALVLGAGGFIGGHLVTKLKELGYWVRGVDIKNHEFKKSDADEFILGDLRNYETVNNVITNDIDEVYQLAADMGGAEYVFSGEYDANIMHNSCMINLHVCQVCVDKKIKRVFYSSSACIYPKYNQEDPENPKCSEESAYPAFPDSEYGWEKLFSERLYMSYAKNFGLSVRIARYHNIFGPYGTYKGGKEKAPAALCRKVCQTPDFSYIDVYGDGQQTRSFLYIDDCIEATLKLMHSDFQGPVNIGSEEMVTINQLAKMIINISKKSLEINNILEHKNTGVRGRNSDNKMIREVLGWDSSISLNQGLIETYKWIKNELSL